MYSPTDDFSEISPGAPSRGASTPAAGPQDALGSLILAISGRESSGNPNAIAGGRAGNPKDQGARGKMQITPATFKQYAEPGHSFDNEDHRTIASVKKIMDDFAFYGGDPMKTAAAYLGGRGAVLKDGTIRSDVTDSLGTNPASYAQQVVARMSRVKPPQGVVAEPNRGLVDDTRGADIGFNHKTGEIYANGQRFDSTDYGKAIATFRGGGFTKPGNGTLPAGFVAPRQGDVETYFSGIIPTSTLGKSLRAGVENYKGGWNEILGAAQQMMGRTPTDNTGIAAAERNKNYAGQVGALNTAPQTWDAAHGAMGVGELTLNKAVESLPYMAELLGPGIVGGVTKAIAMKGARAAAEDVMLIASREALARGASQQAAQQAGERAAMETMSFGTRYAPEIAMMAGSYPSSLGDVLGNQREEAGRYNVPAAAAAAGPYAALNMIGGGAQAVRALTGDAVHGAVSTARGVPGRVMRGAGAAVVTGAEEAAGEFGQEVMNQAGRMGVNPNATLTSPDAMQRYRESAIVGGLVGAGMGGVTGVASRAHQQVDLLNSVPVQPDEPVAAPTPVAAPPVSSIAPQNFTMTPGESPDGEPMMGGSPTATDGTPNVFRQRRPGQPAPTMTPGGDPTFNPANAVDAPVSGEIDPSISFPDIVTGQPASGVTLESGRGKRGAGTIENMGRAAKDMPRQEEKKRVAGREKLATERARRKLYGKAAAQTPEPVTAGENRIVDTPVAAASSPADDLEITPEEAVQVSRQMKRRPGQFAAAEKGKAPKRAPVDKVMTPAQIKKLSDDTRDDGELNTHLDAIDDLNPKLASPDTRVSQSAKDKGVPLYRRRMAPPRKDGENRTASIALERLTHIKAVTDHFDKLIAKHGVGGVNAMFAHRKSSNTETNPGVDEEGSTDESGQVNANIRLSNLWRLYRDGHFEGGAKWGFTSNKSADIRDRTEEGGKPNVLKKYFAGEYKMLHEGRKGGRPVPQSEKKGVKGLAYYMFTQGRTDLERMLGSRLFNIFKENGGEVDLQIFDGDITIDGEKVLGSFLTPPPGKSYGVKHDGGTAKITKPTLVFSSAGANEETLMHEMLHAATVHVIETNAGVRDRFMPIVKALRANNVTEKSNSLNTILAQVSQADDVHAVAELVSYGFTNPEFQEHLKSIEMKPPRGGVVSHVLHTAFHYFVNIVKLALGAHGAKVTALSRLIEEGARLMDVAEDTPVSSSGGKFAQAVGTMSNAPHSNFLNPVTVVEKTFKAVVESALPFLYRTEANDKTKFENFVNKHAGKLSEKIIQNHPRISRIAAGLIDKFGVPESFTSLLDMGRKKVHNAGQVAFTIWENLKGLTEAEQKDVHDWLESGGTLDISKIPADRQAMLNNLSRDLKEIVARAAEQGALPAGLKNANITELVKWITSNTARMSFGLKTTNAFKSWPKGYTAFARDHAVLGDGDAFHRGRVRYPNSTEDKADYVYVPVGADLQTTQEEFGHPIELETDRVWRQLSAKGKGRTMWSAIPFAEGRKLSKSADYTDALVMTVHNLLHDTAANEFANTVVSTSNVGTDDALVFKDKDALTEHLGGEQRIIDKPDHYEKKLLARTPGYWVKLGGGYGKLSNHYVPATVYTMITDVHDKSPMFDNYKEILNFWKKTKTAYSIPTHFNNVASSFVMMYMNDVKVSTLQRAFGVFLNRKGDDKKLWDEFAQSGALVASFSAGEIGTSIARKLNDAVRGEHYANSANGMMQLLHKLEQTKGAMAARAGASWVEKVAVGAYETEDNIFRLAAFMDARDRGMSVDKAGKFAADAMINYSIDARYINNLRSTIMPFLAWPYRMVPMLIRTALFKPWKIATMSAAIYTLNALAYAITGADEDEERKKLPEYLRGNLFMMPGAPQSLRLPFSVDGKPVFWNVANFMPLGNFAQEARNGLFGLPWPQGMMPSGPLWTAAEIGLGYDSFTGKPINAPTDTNTEKFGNSMKQAWNAFTPNLPLPYNRQGDKFYDLLRSKHGITGGETDWGTSVLGMVGPKIVAVDETERSAQAGVQIRAIVGDYRRAIGKLAREEMRYGNPDMEKVHDGQAQLIADMLKKIRAAKGEPDAQ